jgi:hypothetical protein
MSLASMLQKVQKKAYDYLPQATVRGAGNNEEEE